MGNLFWGCHLLHCTFSRTAHCSLYQSLYIINLYFRSRRTLKLFLLIFCFLMFTPVQYSIVIFIYTQRKQNIGLISTSWLMRGQLFWTIVHSIPLCQLCNYTFSQPTHPHALGSLGKGAKLAPVALSNHYTALHLLFLQNGTSWANENTRERTETGVFDIWKHALIDLRCLYKTLFT